MSFSFKKPYIFLFVAFFFFKNSISQSDYFQQKVDTYIEVKLNDLEHSLSAYEEIVYTNNSPHSLDSIIVHLWPNAYKNINTAMAKHDVESGETKIRFAPAEQRGYIDSLDFKSDNKRLKWHYYKDNIDIAVVHLNQALKSSESIKISTPFYVKLPKGIFSRLGHIGQSYQVTQWFPKPAVFDKNGWHPLPYLSQGEFYSEFGSYDVKITLPENYVLGATGDLVNGEEEIDFLLHKVKETDSIKNSGNYNMYDLSFPESSKNLKTLHFHQENIHDFAWFADKRYHVLKGEVELPESKRKVTTWAMFTNNEFDLWEKSIEYLNDATYYYSLWVGEYPYNHVTAVDGSISAGGGMEYPNITVIGESYSAYSHDEVITHEVGHNWYYGILGSNERVNAWMDEGMNTYAELRYMEQKYKKDDISMSAGLLSIDNLGSKGLMNLAYQFNAKRNQDQPIQMGASLYTPMNYGSIVYGKTGIGFHYLMAYLGEELFDKCMHAYFDKWKFKHPGPDDLQQVFEETSKKNLSWFFHDFIKTTKKIDYKFQCLKKESDDQYKLKLKNNTGFPAPISITSINKTNNESHTTWIEGFIGDTSLTLSSSIKPTHFIIDESNQSMDIDKTNNVISTKGILKKQEPLKFAFLAGLDDQNKSKIYYAPLLGWNAYDKLMPGIALYNTLIFEKKMEWLIAPMFSIGNKSINGTAKFNYHFYPKQIASKITLGYKGSSYYQGFDAGEKQERWIKNEIRTDVKFKEKSIRNSPLHNLSLKAIRIDDHILSGNFIYPPETENQTSYFGVIDYTIKNKQFLTPKSISLRYIYGQNITEQLVSSFSLTGNYRLNYNSDLKGIELRFFGGYNFYINDLRYGFFMKGQDGFSDYLYERTYLGRNKYFPNALSQQSSISHGGFKINTPLGISDRWILASNIKVEIPKIPIGVFADIGSYPSILITSSGMQNKVNYLFNSGMYFSLKLNKKEILGVYLPLLYSKNIAETYSYGQSIETINDISFLQRITFIINFNEINPFQIIKNIAP